MALNEPDMKRPCSEVKTIEALASALDIAIMVYDRNDTLIVSSASFLRFFDVAPELLTPGARLRDLFAATFDAGARVLGTLNGKARNVSREDWVAERIAIHWRERYDSVEKLADGRWVRLCKRRMPDGLLIATIEDVSEQKRRDEEMTEIQQKAEFAQYTLDNLANPVVVKDSELRYVFVNYAFCRILGLNPKQILGHTASSIAESGLAGRIDEIQNGVLKTGVPYEAIQDVCRADGSVMRSITRIRRTGRPGNYFVTASFDDISAVASTEIQQVEDIIRYSFDVTDAADEAGKPGDEVSGSGCKGRILVLDEDCQGSANRVAELKKAGFDAVAIASATEAIAFLEAAQSMKLAIDEVEITAQLAKALFRNGMSALHDVLQKAIVQRLAAEGPTSSTEAPAPRRSETSPAPVLSIVASAPQSSTDAPAPARSAPHNSEPAAPVESEKATASPARDRIRVLVAEDNDVNQIVFEQILEGIGVDFRIVCNGQEAVAAWQVAAPDLILMDVSMPVMNGLQAAQAIRDAETTQGEKALHVPIIAVTAHAMSGDRERCLAAGMDDYLSKPVSPEKLESIIQKWVGSAESFLAVG